MANNADAAGDQLAIIEIGSSKNGQVWWDGDSIVYQHDGTETTEGSFNYTVSDGNDWTKTTV